jgi:hypothetical protein
MVLNLPTKYFNIYKKFENGIFTKQKNSIYKLEYVEEQLNLYKIDIIIKKELNNLKSIIKYFKNIDYRNNLCNKNFKYTIINKIDDNNWIEEELYNNVSNYFNVIITDYNMICYTVNDKPELYNKTIENNLDVSDLKYYYAYKILKIEDNIIFRFEIVYNRYDINQDIDIKKQYEMINNIINIIYKVNNI